MTDLAPPLTTTTPRRARPLPSTLAFGLVGGCALGIAARAWMRLIAEEPEFTWNGTIFIVLAFTVFGTTQAIATVVRARARRRWAVALARIVGSVGIMPLFVGAGAIMAPTVVGAGFAVARVGWPRWIRWICALIAAGPVVIVLTQLIGSFGWSLHTAAGFLAMLAVYGTIVSATRSTFTPRRRTGKLPRWAIAIGVIALLLLLLSMTGLR